MSVELGLVLGKGLGVRVRLVLGLGLTSHTY